MHVDTDDLATLLKMQHLDLEAMRDKKKLEELPQRAVILEARSKKKAIEQKRAQLDALHAKADAQLSRIDDEDRSLSEKQRQVQSEIDAVRGDYRGVEARTKELNGFAKRRNTLEADLTAVGDELAKIEGVRELGAPGGRGHGGVREGRRRAQRRARAHRGRTSDAGVLVARRPA